MLLKFRLPVTSGIAALMLFQVSLSLAQNTAPVPTTFEIVSPADGNAASLINTNYGTTSTTNHRIFYGGDFAYSGASNTRGFSGYAFGGGVEATRKARGNPNGSRLTLGGTEVGTDPAYPTSGAATVGNLPGSRAVASSYDSDDLGDPVTWLDYGGANGFIAVNEGDTLEINITGFIDPNNRMVQNPAAPVGSDYSGSLLKSKDGNSVAGNDGANNVTYSALNLPEGATFVGTRLRWVPNFVQGDGATDNSLRNAIYFIDANISNGNTASEAAYGSADTTRSATYVGRGKGELRDSLYVIYFKATDDSQQGNDNAIDSLFIMVNDSLPNPAPHFTQYTILRKDSLGVQQLRKYNYLAGAPDTLFSVFEGDSVVVTFYAEDQDSLQGEVNDPVAFGLLWNDNILGVSKGGTTTGPFSGFRQFIKRANSVDTLAVDTVTYASSAGLTARFRVSIQLPFNLATSNEKADTIVVMVSDGGSITADTFALKVRNTNRAPLWDRDTTSTPSDSALAYSSNPAAANPDSIQAVSAFTVNNNQTDSTYFSRYVYDPDFLAGDSLGLPLTFSRSGNYKGDLNSSTGLNVYTPSVADTITYTFTITATDSYSANPKSTAQQILFRVAPAPEITGVEPGSGSINQEINIYGTGFGLYDTKGADTSRVYFYATTTGGVRQNIVANIISWAREKIVFSVPASLPASRLGASRSYLLPDTLVVRSAIYGGFDTWPFTVLVDSSGIENLQVASITPTSVVIRYRTNFTGADSVVVAGSSDTLDIRSGNFSLPTFVEYNNGLSQIRSTKTVFKDQTSATDGVHVIQLTNLSPNTLYRFFIASSNNIYAADSLRKVNGPYRPKKIDLGMGPKNASLDAFRFRTLPSVTSTGALYAVTGKAYYSAGAATDAIVTLRLVKSDSPGDTSLLITTTVGSDSLWQLNLANLRKASGISFNHSAGDLMLFEFDGAEKGFEQYDTVRAGNSASPMSLRKIKLVPYVKYDLQLSTGLNLIGIPLNLFKGQVRDAHEFLSQIRGGAPSITRYITATGTQETITRAIDGRFVGAENFNLSLSESYFAEVNSKTVVQFEGRAFTQPLAVISFPGAGLYFVSRPAQDPTQFYSWDAKQILQQIPNVTTVIGYDELLQSYQQYLRSGSSYIGTNFGIDVGRGYIFQVSAAASWNPNGSGTLLASSSQDGSAAATGDRVIVVDIAKPEDAVSPSITGLSNISSAAVTVTWLTGSSDPGQLRLSLADGSGESVVKPDIRGLSYGMNLAQVTGLKPFSEYVYRLESSAGVPLAGLTPGRFTTARIGIGPEPYSLFGRLVDPSGKALSGMLVFLRLKRGATGLESGYLGAVSDDRGYWVLNLANAKEKDSGLPFAWSAGDQIELTVIGGSFRKVFTAQVVPGSPHNIAIDLQESGVTDDNAQKKPVSVNLPKAYSLTQNFPNPFNPSTTISYSIPEGAGPVQVRLDIYNLRGQLVTTLVNKNVEPGDYRVQWEGLDNIGRPVSSGVYFYRLKTPQFNATRKMVILK